MFRAMVPRSLLVNLLIVSGLPPLCDVFYALGLHLFNGQRLLVIATIVMEPIVRCKENGTSLLVINRERRRVLDFGPFEGVANRAGLRDLTLSGRADPLSLLESLFGSASEMVAFMENISFSH